jgi:hypothetical protein
MLLTAEHDLQWHGTPEVANDDVAHLVCEVPSINCGGPIHMATVSKPEIAKMLI